MITVGDIVCNIYSNLQGIVLSVYENTDVDFYEVEWEDGSCDVVPGPEIMLEVEK